MSQNLELEISLSLSLSLSQNFETQPKRSNGSLSQYTILSKDTIVCMCVCACVCVCFLLCVYGICYVARVHEWKAWNLTVRPNNNNTNTNTLI